MLKTMTHKLNLDRTSLTGMRATTIISSADLRASRHIQTTFSSKA